MKEDLWEKVVEVRRASDIVMAVVLIFEEYLQRLTWGRAPQSRRNFEEKQSFHDELKSKWDILSEYDLVMCLGEYIKHMGRHVDRFDVVVMA